MWAHTVRCARAVRKVGCFPPPVATGPRVLSSEVAKAVGGGYCRLHMALKLARGVRGTVAGHRLGTIEVGGGMLPPCNASLGMPPSLSSLLMLAMGPRVLNSAPPMLF